MACVHAPASSGFPCPWRMRQSPLGSRLPRTLHFSAVWLSCTPQCTTFSKDACHAPTRLLCSQNTPRKAGRVQLHLAAHVDVAGHVGAAQPDFHICRRFFARGVETTLEPAEQRAADSRKRSRLTWSTQRARPDEIRRQHQAPGSVLPGYCPLLLPQAFAFVAAAASILDGPTPRPPDGDATSSARHFRARRWRH